MHPAIKATTKSKKVLGTLLPVVLKAAMTVCPSVDAWATL
jgi:hypothetical protein